MFRVLLAAMLCVAAWAPFAEAAGFAMYEFSARGNALGGAMTARRADPSSIAFNPALVTQLEGTQALAGATVVAPQVSVDVNGHTTDAESNMWTIPHAYATTQINDNLFLGVGTFSRFGLGTEYPSGWVGRNDLRSVNIQSMSVNPVLGVRNGNLALGLGVEAMWFEYDQGATDIDGRVKGDSTGFGLNGGLWWKATDSVALGGQLPHAHQAGPGRPRHLRQERRAGAVHLVQGYRRRRRRDPARRGAHGRGVGAGRPLERGRGRDAHLLEQLRRTAHRL